MTRLPAALPDTSVWIDPPAGGLADYVDSVAVSMVTIAELYYGSTMQNPLQSLVRRRRLREILDEHDVLPLDLATAEIYGAFAGIIRATGRNPRPRRFDLLIAATAARHQVPLLTRDRDGFVGLEDAVQVVRVD